MKALLRIIVAATLAAAFGFGCSSTGGGSQTNWIVCKTSADCRNGQVCVDERCASREAGATGETSAAIRTSCDGRLDGTWGQCLAFESECHGDTATLRVVRTAICMGNGEAVVSCTDPDGQHVQVVAKVPAFGGTLPSLSVCACEPKTMTARDADLKVANDSVQMTDVVGCRSDGVSVDNLSGIGGNFAYKEGGPPGHPYGGQDGTDAGTCKFSFGSAIGGCVSFNACFVGCTTSADCPDPGSGTPKLDCAPLVKSNAGLGKTCMLRCDVEHVCPNGMLCVHGGNLGGDLCLWPRADHGVGCP